MFQPIPPTRLIPPKPRIPRHYIIRRGRMYDLDRKPVEPSGAAVLVEALTFHNSTMHKTAGRMTAREKADSLVRMARAQAWME